MVDEMCRTGVPPNVATFNTLISAACDHSQAVNALKLLVKMEVQSCKPDIKTYTPLLKLCCKKQWMKILLFLVCHMFKKDITPDFSTYTLLVSWLCRNGKPAQSCLFLEEMVLKGFTPKQETFDLVMEKLDKGNLHSAKKKVQLLIVQAAAAKHTGSSYLSKDAAAAAQN
jgi:pentatricopeptide repeat protein